MTTSARSPLRDLLDAWEHQQARYHSDRLGALAAIVDAVVTHHGDSPTVVDLGGGPASFAAHRVPRAPGATVTVVDLDPVLLTLASQRDDLLDGAVRVLRTDVRGDEWTELEPGPDVMVALSTVHYLREHEVAALYERVRRTLRPGGLFVVADTMPHGDQPERASRSERPDAGEWTWERWWGVASSVPELAPAFAERARTSRPPSAEWSADETWHRAHLASAGFASAIVLHRAGADAVLAATT